MSELYNSVILENGTEFNEIQTFFNIVKIKKKRFSFAESSSSHYVRNDTDNSVWCESKGGFAAFTFTIQPTSCHFEQSEKSHLPDNQCDKTTLIGNKVRKLNMICLTAKIF